MPFFKSFAIAALVATICFFVYHLLSYLLGFSAKEYAIWMGLGMGLASTTVHLLLSKRQQNSKDHFKREPPL